MNALDYYYDDAVCTAEGVEEMKELLTLKTSEIASFLAMTL
jgi:hypothetical protein